MGCKMFRCRLKTGGKSINQISERFKGQGLTDLDFANLKKAYDIFDGLDVVLSVWDWDSQSSYHLDSWKPADDELIMSGIYYAEQTHPFPRYKDNYPKFYYDWKTNHYDFDGASLTFPSEDVEVVEEIEFFEL